MEGTAMKVLNSAADAAWLADPPSAEQLLPGHPSSLAVWGEADTSTLICRQVQDITHDVKTFLFEPAQPRCSSTSRANSSLCSCRSTGAPSAGVTRSPLRRPAPISWVSPSNASLEALCRTGCTTR